MEAVASSSKDVPIQLSTSDSEDAALSKDTKRDSGGIWKCFCCNLKEHYDYKGAKPPFAKHLTFSEDCYIMKDPFSPINKNDILILGADCSICNNSICMECSLFYTKRFCKICALKNVQSFPLKLQAKIVQLNQENEEE